MAELDPKKQIALAEYQEVVAQVRALTDIRFKLLTYLPLGTVAAAVFGSQPIDLAKQRAISAFAFVVTLCIATYNKRNDQFYDELIARAAELERELEIEHGSFRYRPKPWLKYQVAPKYRFEHVLERPRSWLKYASVTVEHRWPIGWIYLAAATLWAYLFVDAFARDQYLPKLLPSWLISLQPRLVWFQSQLIWLKAFVPFVAFVCWRQLHSMENHSQKKQRETVKCLMMQLAGLNVGPLQAEQNELVETIVAQPILGIDEDKVRRRIVCHWNRFGQKRNPRAASALLANVIDLPARWIQDVWTGRR